MLERLFPQQSDDKLMVEDCFSCFLYTGDGSTQTITNGIDLAGEGGMLWRKSRGFSGNHVILDTVRGIASYLESNTTSAAGTGYNWIASFNSDGFTNNNNSVNSGTCVSWTFRKAPKFFDVVTYTGNGTDNRQIAHNLGVAPGFIVVKSTSSSNGWACWHRGNGTTNYNLRLNSTGEGYTPTNIGGFPVAASSTTFTVRNGVNGWDGVNYSANDTGQTYVAYLFAHDPSADGIIQCGSYVGNGDDIGPTITLGWEPQWLLIKRATASENWVIYDNMRGVPTGGIDAQLSANLSSSEQLAQNRVDFTATGFIPRQGFTTTNSLGDTYIYIAIRRGPMRTPTLGTSVFSPQAVTLNSASNTVVSSGTAGPMDVVINQQRSASGGGGITQSRLTGGNYLITSSTGAEVSNSYTNWDRMTGTKPTPWTDGQSVAAWQFKRAPGFMDVVCYTGNGVAGRTVNHNLGVAPEMMIFKTTGNSNNWCVYNANLGASAMMRLNATDASNSPHPFINYTSPTSTVFTVGGDFNTNHTGLGQIAYLFASVPGVSKVGSYTGNGSSQTINCAFTTGARFVLIKRTDSTGDWYVWDSARGIVAGNDPYLALNSTAAEVTTNDSVDADNTGFVVNQVAASNINVNGATYIFLSVS